MRSAGPELPLPPSEVIEQANPFAGKFVWYCTSAAWMARIDDSAEVSCAWIIMLSMLGIAMSEMIRMTAITIINSMSVKPASRCRRGQDSSDDCFHQFFMT